MTDGVLVLTATEREQADLFNWLEPGTVTSRFGRRWAEGTYGGRPIRLIETGVGAVNTAHTVTVALEYYSERNPSGLLHGSASGLPTNKSSTVSKNPRSLLRGRLQSAKPAFVLQIGIGGAYVSSGLAVGDLAIATEECYGDMGVLTPDGWRGMDFIGFPVVASDPPCFNRFSLNAALVKDTRRCLAAIDWEGSPPQIGVGPFVTVNQCSGVQVAGDAVAARFGGICESMEGAAAAHVCALYGIPFVEVRCISNLVEDRNFSTWNIPLAMRRSQMAAKAVLDDHQGGSGILPLCV